ncbi:hypothetical protein HBH56_097320 [Parastagonospora nodorum]|uniref:Uncharacterized protein n=1 Tax=Phaeosphaeria nodorum (strain SN15 / ATCC MYA-4574 / FGSC 10173) TaxID=321614 RepID=A0A7U2ICI3_PHANO|nr:hypothetical protein HBH56_097320 [Parastagonospora nodorum]QRD07314.1 hypothetical protein JI435_424220 [Parastagonospora nodorum SN15]KAH3930447.1 hypothetical protein HBH54_111640 [Parastagonospora nodorum]KAH4026860.1 hypothetical protein HBI09_145050 [Parastagonospora nodorum]KAH4136413.1 hypothetical protein HBH45_139460 [Parastagonospora nodorum]
MKTTIPILRPSHVFFLASYNHTAWPCKSRQQPSIPLSKCPLAQCLQAVASRKSQENKSNNVLTGYAVVCAEITPVVASQSLCVSRQEVVRLAPYEVEELM